MVASGTTTSGPLNTMLSLLTTYATLVPNAINAMQFLDQYQAALAEDTAGVILWAAKESSAADEVRIATPSLLCAVPIHDTSTGFAISFEDIQVHQHDRLRY